MAAVVGAVGDADRSPAQAVPKAEAITPVASIHVRTIIGETASRVDMSFLLERVSHPRV
jgi:hypothetical protein